MPYTGSYCEFFQIVNPFRTNSLFLHQKLMAQAISTAASDRSESVKHISRLAIATEKIEVDQFFRIRSPDFIGRNNRRFFYLILKENLINFSIFLICQSI